MDKNMDVKDLFKMIKSGAKKDSRQGGKLNSFFEKNPKMKVILPAVFLLISAIVAAIIIFTGMKVDTELKSAEPVYGQASAVEILPQDERHDPIEVDDGADPFEEDILANAKVTGFIYNNGGYWTATISTRNNADGYVVQAGEYVGSSEWYVESVDGESVTLTMGEKTRVIKRK